MGFARQALVLVLAVTLLPAWALALGPVPPEPGPELEVNDYTAGDQLLPAVAALDGGGFVVVWVSDGSPGPDASGTSIQARLLAPDGTPLGAQFQVNTYADYEQTNPAVAAGPGGTFVVVWDSDGSYGSDQSSYSVQGQVFGADGTPLGGEFQVNTYTDSFQRYPEVAVAAPGNFLIVWHSFGSSGNDDSSTSVQGRLFDANGVPAGDDFQVNTFVTHRQKNPAVAPAADDGFMVVWHSEAAGDIRGQLLDAAAGLVGPERAISANPGVFNRIPALAAAADGTFAATWHSDFTGEQTDFRVRLRRLDGAGVPSAGELQVNSYLPGLQVYPDLSAGDDDRFLVVWSSEGSFGSDAFGTSVQARVVGSQGPAAGGELQVNEYINGDQQYPAVAWDPGSGFLVVWESAGSNGLDQSGTSIQARLLVVPLFEDDFESGNLAAWSSSMP